MANKHLTWIDILHLYQPPTQSKEVIDTVAQESYRLILKLLETYPKLKLTINIAGSLLELLDKYGHKDVIEGFKKYALEGRVELLGSAMYHPILPLLPRDEIQRQITLHDTTLNKYFGKAYKPVGFYLPELAYSKKVADVVKKEGFRWIVLDEMHVSGVTVDWNKRYAIARNGLTAMIRNSFFSRSFPPESIQVNREKIISDYLVTVHDGELYGHWHKIDNGHYEKVHTDPTISTLTGSEYIELLKEKIDVTPKEATWESTQDELAHGISYGLWKNPHNDIHKRLEHLKQFVLKTLKKNSEDANYGAARKHADRGIASCAWWWASERQLGPFSPLTWNPTEIEKGAQELLAVVRSLKSAPSETKIRAEKMFDKIHKTIWEKHWKDHPHG